MGNDIATQSVYMRLVWIRRLGWLAGLVYAGSAWYFLDTYYLPAIGLKDLPMWKALIPAGAIGFGLYAITCWLLATICVPGINSMVPGETVEHKGLRKETRITVVQTGDFNTDIEISNFARTRSLAVYFIAVITLAALVYFGSMMAL